MSGNDDFQPARRRVLGTLGMSAAALALAPWRLYAQSWSLAETKKKYPAKVVDLVQRSLVIDMLAPLKIDFNPDAFSLPLSEADAQMFLNCGITGFHNSVGVGGATAYEEALQFIAAWSGFCGRNSEVFSLVGRAEDLDRAKARHKVAVIMGLQNADEFRQPGDVKDFYDVGLRCAQLTYNTQNLIGSGSTERVDGGITDYGVKIVEAMNDVGMLIDVSHSGDRTTLDAIEISPKSIAITHSNCRALNNHPRLKTDEAIRKLAAKGGVMGITGVRMFVKDKEPTTIEDIVDHIDHVVKLVGIEHVGIGSDSDLMGYDHMPKDQYEKLKAAYKSSYAFRDKIDTDGFDHPRKVYDLTATLLKRGYSETNIQAVLGGNFRRLLAATWLEPKRTPPPEAAKPEEKKS
ncbi:MAG TPA: membrane dipeptidase [Rudaea sp.]|jgi:membrane dipeptidase